MSEDFLHYVWKFKRFQNLNLFTTEGLPLHILQTGIHNLDAGPDFSGAKIKIEDTVWAGNVEIHIFSSDWEKHKHQEDPAYDNVILHVVFEHEKDIIRKDGSLIPCLELKELIDENVYQQFLHLMHSNNWIPCQQQLPLVDDFVKRNMIERVLVERLEQKTEYIKASLQLNKNSWEETFYHLLSRHFGMKVNALPFELLAKSLSSTILAKHKNNNLQLEALLFGQAGMLANLFNDPFPKKLQKEYDFLRKKHSLTPIPGHLWKFLRLRPANFPTIRIAELAALITKSSHLFSKILEAGNIQELDELFKVEVSDYWANHYVFDKPSKPKSKSFGKSARENLIINVVAPLLFLYGQIKQSEKHREQAFEILLQIGPENNSIIRNWAACGIKAANAFESQALLHLYKNYCIQKQCLRCNIGNNILKK